VRPDQYVLLAALDDLTADAASRHAQGLIADVEGPGRVFAQGLSTRSAKIQQPMTSDFLVQGMEAVADWVETALVVRGTRQVGYCAVFDFASKTSSMHRCPRSTWGASHLEATISGSRLGLPALMTLLPGHCQGQH
jgi:hypothetical protein